MHLRVTIAAFLDQHTAIAFCITMTLFSKLCAAFHNKPLLARCFRGQIKFLILTAMNISGSPYWAKCQQIS